MRSSKTSARVCPCFPACRIAPRLLPFTRWLHLAYHIKVVLHLLINRQPYSFTGAAIFTHDKQIPLMLRRAVQSALRRPLSTMSTSQTPMEDAIRTKVNHMDATRHNVVYTSLTNICCTDQRSSEANLYGNLQRLPQACSPPGHERQHISRDTFPVKSHSPVQARAITSH